MTLHNQFGESWRVDESDWLFQSEPIKNELADDITTGSAGFQPRYDIVFDNELIRLAAVEVLSFFRSFFSVSAGTKELNSFSTLTYSQTLRFNSVWKETL